MSETSTEGIGEGDALDVEREDPSLSGKPEIPVLGEEAERGSGGATGRLDERNQRQHGIQQHGDAFAVESDEPTDTSGIPHGASNRVTALPGNEPAEEDVSDERDQE